MLDGVIRTNLDFASMADDSVRRLEAEGIWFEFKILRQYQTIYSEALGTMRDINYVIAINTRMIAKEALRKNHNKALDLAIKFFNTYLRATLNENDVRTAYTILNQYRMVAESLLCGNRSADAVRVAEHMKYYAHVSYKKRLPFVTETVAYDLGTLCEVAHDLDSNVEDTLLKIFLEVDPSSSIDDVQETSLRGIRKAQVKLATYYLVHNAKDLARIIWKDMHQESKERLESIREELLSVQSKDFWEISDRGGNFDYLNADRKQVLDVFFRWFSHELPSSTTQDDL